ncbi:MAG: alcohol dehydrogenase catalytic domain-containing protein [bacterium]|nr:alcohol dehydrogenase catalytic domain-containing protein [bacterium]
MSEPEQETYKAAVLDSPGHIRMERRSVALPREKEVLIHVAYAGICGTDIAIRSGQYVVRLPLVLGHEFTGYVEAVGSQVPRDLIGKLVTAEINNTCLSYDRPEKCPACRRGFPNHCMRRTVLGIVNADGVFAEIVRAPFRNVHLLPETISPEEGVFVEPLAAAIRTFELSPVNEGDVVVVLGVGRLGTLLCAVAKERGATVVAVDRNENALERARDFGADHVFLGTAEQAAAQVKSLTEGLGADMVIDATGRSSGLNDALSLVRPRGVVAVKTTCGIPSPPVDATCVAVDEIRIQGSRCGPFPKAIEMLAASRINLAPLISSIFPLNALSDAIQAARTETKVLIKAM